MAAVMRFSKALRWGFAALFSAGIAACGARSALRVDEPAAGGGGSAPIEDAGPDIVDVVDAEPDVVTFDCAEAGVTYIYLVAAENELYAYDPPSGSFNLRGVIDCPASPGATPFSMGVDRQGTAYVVFNDGQLFRVSTFDASCEPTDYVPDQEGFHVFGMGFSTDLGGPSETLYLAEINFSSPSLGLASIDTESLELSYVGPFSENPGFALEMTGTGDGRLFGFFLDNPGPGGHVVEIDKQTATILSSTFLDVGQAASALAFAFWGGDFYIFTSPGDGFTDVTRYSPEDGSLTVVKTLSATIVGAGVSTCAPSK